MKNVPTGSKKEARDRHTLSEVALQPWFLPRELSWKIRCILPNDYWRKMRYYFDDYGCLRCAQKSVVYGFNGLCRVCYKLIVHRIGFALASRGETGVKPQYSKQRLSRIAYAHELLRDLK